MDLTPVAKPEIAFLVVQMGRDLEMGTPKPHPHPHPYSFPHPVLTLLPTPTLHPLPPHSWLRQEERCWWCGVRERGRDQRPNPEGHQPFRS